MTITAQSLSIFFPAHNEAENLPELIARTTKAVRGNVADYEIIVVDDGSTDQTPAVLEKLTTEYPELRYVRHPVNRGYGGALKTGFAAATKDLVFFSDSDNQFDLSEITKFLAEIDHYDAVLGYRINRRDPFHRKVFAFCWGTLIRCLFGFRVRDLDCAFKMFHRYLLTDIEFQAEGAMITVELLAKLSKRQFRYTEIGVTHYPRQAGTQSGGNPKVVVRAFMELFRLYRKIR